MSDTALCQYDPTDRGRELLLLSKVMLIYTNLIKHLGGRTRWGSQGKGKHAL